MLRRWDHTKEPLTALDKPIERNDLGGRAVRHDCAPGKKP